MFIELKLLTILTLVIFTVGFIGILFNRKNIIMVMLAVEVVLLAVNLNFAFLSVYLDDVIGQIFIIFILTIAAAESAIGLSLITCLFQLKNSIELKSIKKKFNKI